MDVFRGRLKPVVAQYRAVDHRGVLGVEEGALESVTVFVDEAYMTAFQAEIAQQTSDILVYAQPDSVLGSKDCVGGTLTVDGRTLRIEGYGVARNPRAARDLHIELRCNEI